MASQSTTGSELLAQDFKGPQCFHPRGSAAKYDPKASMQRMLLGIFDEPRVNVLELNMALQQIKYKGENLSLLFLH